MTSVASPGSDNTPSMESFPDHTYNVNPELAVRAKREVRREVRREVKGICSSKRRVK
jgi:hypothetical protein